MVDNIDKIMKDKLPSTEELWKVITATIRNNDGISLYEIETKCGKLLLVSNKVWYYKSEDIKNSNVKNILNERIRLLIYNRMMLFGLVTLEETYYRKTPYFNIYDFNFDMSFSMKDFKQLEIENPDIYDYIPKNSKKYDRHIRNNRLKSEEIIDINEEEEEEEYDFEDGVKVIEKIIDEDYQNVNKKKETNEQLVKLYIEYCLEQVRVRAGVLSKDDINIMAEKAKDEIFKIIE